MKNYLIILFALANMIFTKKDEGEIEFLDGVDTTNPIDSPFFVDKINEFVDAVNSIRKELNNG